MWSLPVTIPDNPLRYVLAYLLELGRERVALVDTGWPADVSWRELCAGLEATGHAIDHVETVLLTHAHHDHHGLSARVREASGARIGMHPAEAAVVRRIAAMSSAGGGNQSAWLLERGSPPDEAERLEVSMRGMGRHFRDRLATPDVLVGDGDRPLKERPDLRAVWTPGHTDGHLCFLLEDERLLLSGDHLLPRITPHVSRAPGLEGNDPIGSYLVSLAASGGLVADEVLPAHEYRFEGLQCRVDAMVQHHEHRLAEIESAVREQPGGSTWDVARTITWSRGWEDIDGLMRQTAVSETYTHLLHLVAQGRIRSCGDDRDAWVLSD